MDQGMKNVEINVERIWIMMENLELVNVMGIA